jgi:hypothetical protein
MNVTRLAFLVAGMGLVLVGAAVLYYQTDLRNQVPEGVAVATLLALAGLFVIALAGEFQGFRAVRRVERVEDVSEPHAHVDRPARPLRARSGERHERVERIEETRYP